MMGQPGPRFSRSRFFRVPVFPGPAYQNWLVQLAGLLAAGRRQVKSDLYPTIVASKQFMDALAIQATGPTSRSSARLACGIRTNRTSIPLRCRSSEVHPAQSGFRSGPPGSAPTSPLGSRVATGGRRWTTSRTLPASHATARLSGLSRNSIKIEPMVVRFAPVRRSDGQNEALVKSPFFVRHQISCQAALHHRYQLASRSARTVNPFVNTA